MEIERVFENAYWILERDRAKGLLVVRRTAQPYPQASDIALAFNTLERAMDAQLRARFSLLVDLRSSPARNDPDFEREADSHAPRFARGFVRAAALVRTAAGVLQVQRKSRQHRARLEVFDNEAAALGYLCPSASRERA